MEACCWEEAPVRDGENPGSGGKQADYRQAEKENIDWVAVGRVSDGFTGSSGKGGLSNLVTLLQQRDPRQCQCSPSWSRPTEMNGTSQSIV